MVRSGVSGPENVGAPRKAGAIVALLRAGKRVGVSSNSHKAINKLLSEVEARAAAGGAVAGGHALADAVSPRWIAWPSTKTRGNILRRSSATGTRPNPSSCRSFLHDLQERMGKFQLARTGDQSTGNKLI